MSHEIPTVPVGSIKTEQDGDDLFLLLHGLPSSECMFVPQFGNATQRFRYKLVGQSVGQIPIICITAHRLSSYKILVLARVA
jgi:hypothetical protein